MNDLPAGTLTFLFTDIEGSTRLLQAHGDAYAKLLAEHDRVLLGAVAEHGGQPFGSEGDAQHLVFSQAVLAVRAAVAAQRALAAASWPGGPEVRVRMGLHTGEARRVGDDYVGLVLHETARIADAGHGGQVLLSAATHELVRGALPEGVDTRDLGEHRLKDLTRPLRIYQLVIEGLPADFPPLRTLEAVGARLPAQLTSFVGRAEVEAVTRLFDGARLVTLTGPGGTGKTRLSIEVARELAPRFRDGVFFVALDAVTDAALVASEVAAALGLTGGSEPPLERLVGYLRDLRVLLVLDNLEQIIDAGATVARLVRECPGLAVIVTSRIPLRVYGEQEFPVPALSLPSVTASDAAAALGSEAVRLFLDRAAAARPGFRLADEQAPAVVDIVRRLDGLPLAIELAAARLRTLPLEALRSRLERSLALLTSGPRDLPARQQTLRGAIAWSHDLLDVPDRRLFARFSVMAGGGALEQAEPVCGPAEDIGRDVFEGLQSLTEQSLLRVEASEEARFAMLATIREYASERLEESAEAELVRRRHAEAYLALAEAAEPELLGRDAAAWNDRLEEEHDNHRAALDWIVRADEAELGLRLVAALWRFWQVRGHLDEAAARIEAVLGLPSEAAQEPSLRVRARFAGGGVAYWRSRLDVAHRMYRSALELARETGDPRLIAEALYNAGFAPLPEVGDQAERYRQGRPFYEESLALYRQLGDRAGEASALWALAGAMAAYGDAAAYLSLAERSLELSREVGDPFRIGWAAHMLGLGRMATGRPGEAAPLFREALGIWVAAGDRSGVVVLLADVSGLARLIGDEEIGWQLAGAVDRMRVETGTELVTEEAEFLGWEPLRSQPVSDEEGAWFSAGGRLTDEAAVGLALNVLERAGSR